MKLTIRRGSESDLSRIVAFNAAMALETEGKTLDQDLLSRGVEHLMAHREKGFYLVAEKDGEVVGCLMITHEWSDWRNGSFWWIQSVYVTPAHRRQGVYSALYGEVRRMAIQDPHVIGFRLYVEKDNRTARETYVQLGMTESPYRLYEAGLGDPG